VRNEMARFIERVAAALTVFLVCQVGCVSAREASATTPVILISVDTLRADHLGSYGYRRFPTPRIDALESGGTVFTQIDSQVPLTLPSHASLMTSTYPFANGAEENEQVVGPGAVTLAALLKAQGYRTAAFIGGYFLARRFGLGQGFDVYDAPFRHSGSLAKALDLKRPAALVTRAATKWIESNRGAPFFVFIHLFDLHHPYDPPHRLKKPYGDDEYDAELGYVDQELGRLWNFLVRQGLYERALIIFIADHGESLGDHGESTHGYFIYQSTLHVPLIIHWPLGSGPFPKRVEAPAGLIDVAPTILQFLNLPTPQSFQGQSLLGLLTRAAPTAWRGVYSESDYARDHLGFAPLRSLRLGNEKYIEAPTPELYDLRRDPSELHNLFPERQAEAQSLRARLLEFRTRYQSTKRVAAPATGSEVARRLRALGYLATSSPVKAADESGPDPKDRIAEYRVYLRGTRLLGMGRLAEAEATFKEILEEDDANLNSRYNLALCELREGKTYDAIAQLKYALAIDPHDLKGGELLANIWIGVGQYERARAELAELRSIAPQPVEVEFGLGRVAFHENRLDDALRHFTAVLRARPESARATIALGRVYFARGQLSLAATEFVKSTQLSPSAPEGYYDLGLVLEKQQHPHAASNAFHQSLQRDPHFAPARRALHSLRSSRG